MFYFILFEKKREIIEIIEMNTISYSKRNIIIALICLFIIILFFLTLYSFDSRSSSKRDINSNNDQVRKWIDEFAKVGAKTDNVNVHKYQGMYGTHMGPLRDKKELNLMLVGLGCHFQKQPGASLNLWSHYLPNAKISAIESFRECADQFKDKADPIYVGDQSDLNFLREIIEGTNEYMDVVIDDGVRSRKQQIHSFIGLWPLVKPNGGIYVVENFYTSFSNHSNDFTESFYDYVIKMIYMFNEDMDRLIDLGHNYLKPMQLNAEISEELKNIFNDVLSVNCYYHACLFIKKYEM